MSSIDQDGVQLAARAPLDGMKLLNLGRCIHLIVQIVPGAHRRGCSMRVTDWDVEQEAVPGLHERGKPMFRGLSSDMTVEPVQKAQLRS